MEPLIIKPSVDIPEITLQVKEEGLFFFKGKSLPEDVDEFYAPIINWLEKYAENPKPQSIFHFEMDYFNTASSKKILDILYIAKDINDEGKQVKIKWLYSKNDTDMLIAGEEFMDIIEMQFQFIER